MLLLNSHIAKKKPHILVETQMGHSLCQWVHYENTLRTQWERSFSCIYR